MSIPGKSKEFPVMAAAALTWAVMLSTMLAEEPTSLKVRKEESRIHAQVSATGHSFDAVVTDYEAEIQWSPERDEIVSARLVADFEDVETGRDRRDREMREWLGYDTHPHLEFVLDRLEPAGDGERQLAIGTLAFHGVEQPIAIPVRIDETSGGIRVRGRTVIDHRDWGLEQIRAFLFMTVDPELDVIFDILAEPVE